MAKCVSSDKEMSSMEQNRAGIEHARYGPSMGKGLLGRCGYNGLSLTGTGGPHAA